MFTSGMPAEFLWNTALKSSIFLEGRLWKILLISCSNSSSAIVFLCSQAESIFFNADLVWENSTLHFNYPASVWFHISILFKVIFCEIGTLLTNSRSDTKVSNCFSPIAFKSLIAVLTDSGKRIFVVVKFNQVIFHRWVHCNAFNTSINVGRESWRGWLPLWCLVLDSARISFPSRYSSNSSITWAISGLQVS